MKRQRTGDNREGINRRDFLKSAVAGGAIGAAAIAAPRILHAANRGDVIRLGLIGCGTEGRVLINSVWKCCKAENVRFRAVCDIWEHYRTYASNLLRSYRQPVGQYIDYGDMLDREKGNLDAVIIATPDWVHHTHAIACMQAGLDVYCEKEMSNSIDNARKMVQASRQTGRLLQIGHQRRSNPRYRTLHDYIVNRKVCGRLTHVAGNWNRHRPLKVTWASKYNLDLATLRRYGYESMEHLRNWRWYRKYSGGPMADLGSHQVDIFNWILGRPPASVMASGGGDNYPAMEWCDNIIAVYEWHYADGGAARVVRGAYALLSTTSHGGYQEVFMGTDGTAIISENCTKGGFRRELSAEESEWEKRFATGPVDIVIGPSHPLPGVTVSRIPGRYYPPIPAPIPPKTEHQPHLENFFHAIRGTEKLTCPAEIAFETAVTILKVDQAVKAEQRLAFDPEEFKA